MWKLQHEEGQREINELHVPVGRDVKMIMTSQDVIHSFYVPAFRIKQDVLPGRYTTHGFVPLSRGHIICSAPNIAASQHSGMIGKIVVMEPAQYEAWLSGGGATGSWRRPARIFSSNWAASTCHRSDTQGRGPNLVGLFGKPVQLEDGRMVTRRRKLHPRIHSGPGRKSGERIQTHHAGFPGNGERRTTERAGGIRKVVEQPHPRDARRHRRVVPAGAKPQETKVQ